MATILLAWELGGGLGHLMRLRPLAEGLVKRGHRVVAIVRDLSRAGDFFSDPAMIRLQAPFKTPSGRDIEPTCTFAQSLHNCGFGDGRALMGLANAWRNLYETFRPDLILFDHSPTALLAAQAYPAARRALVGTGFASPPDITPLPNLRTWHDPDWPQLQIHEREVLANLNTVLANWKLPPLERASLLYQTVDENFLLTFRELDFYAGCRRACGFEPQPSPVTSTGEGQGEAEKIQSEDAVKYWGAWSAGMGSPPEWPAGSGKRIFAYLKPFAAFPQLLDRLCALPNPTLIYAPALDARVRGDVRAPNVLFLDRPVEMSRVAQECDMAILNGTHATTVAMFLAGKPALHVPLLLEQALNARAVQRIGAGICASPKNREQVVKGLESLLSLERLATGAKAFAARYAAFDPNAQLERLADKLTELANRSQT